jgi:hypothetical protein
MLPGNLQGWAPGEAIEKWGMKKILSTDSTELTDIFSVESVQSGEAIFKGVRPNLRYSPIMKIFQRRGAEPQSRKDFLCELCALCGYLQRRVYGTNYPGN